MQQEMNVKNICTVYDWIHQRDEIEKVKNKKLEEELIINKKIENGNNKKID